MSNSKDKISLVTLGCAKNLVDTEMLVGGLKNNSYEIVEKPLDSDVVIVNTCGFLDKAREESVDTILDLGRLKKEGKIKKLIAMGCFTERYGDAVEDEIPEVDKVFGSEEHASVLTYLTGKEFQKNDPDFQRSLLTPNHYAYLKISEGCDRPCSFCAIPLMRGKHKSVSIENLVSQANLLAQKGIKELILIAQDSTYYGIDLYGKRTLSKLLKQLSDVEGIEWIRLHYAFPNGFPLDVLEVIKAEPKICNYIDIPIQHISDKILKSMKRGSSMKKINALLNSFRDIVPGIAIRTTLIVGYPGETDEDFELLKSWLREIKFDRLGCFTYSHEENTGAYDLVDNVPEIVKNQRLNDIMELQSQISWELNQNRVGQTFKVLIDRKRGNYYIGRTQFDSPDVDNEVLIDAKSNFLKVGEFVNAKIIDASDFDLYAEV